MPGELDGRLEAAIERAGRAGKPYLDEGDGLAIAASLGLAVPHREVVAGPETVAGVGLEAFAGDRLVVKVLSGEIAHKSDEGGVAICNKSYEALEDVLAEMQERFAGRDVDGFSVHEHIDYDRSFGSELLLGVRWSNDFGPVAVVGLGGLEVERLAASGGWDPIVASRLVGGEGARLPEEAPLVRLLTTAYRGQPARLERTELEAMVESLLAFGERWMLGGGLSDFEVNPVVLAARGPTALDALARVRRGAVAPAPERPLAKLRCLLEPASIAVAGVSRRMNVGRIILRNILRQGYDRARVRVIKPGSDEIDGCRCVASVAELPERVDLAVLAVSAEQLPAMVDEIVHARRAESLILIPGGLGELEGSEEHAARIARTLIVSRASDWQGPVANGGNCLGVRSLPGGYDTLFIPGHKLRFPKVEPAPLALLSQSGAFAVARSSKLWSLNPRHIVTFGNQIDLTLGDYLEYLSEDPEISVFACYLEGFRALDGERVLTATRRIVESGRHVVLYRAGRTRAGASAAASHTASVAGSYALTRRLAERAGAVMAKSIGEFENLVRMFCLLRDRQLGGRRLGAMSNAGFESVAMGDSLGELGLAELRAETVGEIDGILKQHRLETIVAVRNPLDVTPILGDEGFGRAARAVIEDPAVDLGIVGCVPLTGALQTVAAGADHQEDVSSEEGVARHLIELWRDSNKPWVAVIDSGPLFDPLSQRLEEAGIPTFRSADRALKALNRWAAATLATAV